MFKVRRGGGEEIPLIQGKKQRLRFAGAAVKLPQIHMCIPHFSPIKAHGMRTEY